MILRSLFDVLVGYSGCLLHNFLMTREIFFRNFTLSAAHVSCKMEVDSGVWIGGVMYVVCRIFTVVGLSQYFDCAMTVNVIRFPCL